MKHTMAVFWREITARRDLLFLAVAVLVIVLMMPFVPGTGNYSPSEVRGVVSQVLALLLGCGVAIGLGLSVFGADLSAGRLGFFFARPISARAIWVGRILAVLVLALVCEFVVLVPAMVENIGRLIDFSAKTWCAFVCAFVLLPTILCLASHALSVMNRARSVWLLLDLGGAVAIGVGAWLVIGPLYGLGAVLAIFVVGSLLAIAIAGALGVAGFAGLALGRTDLRRMHGAMSLVLWSLSGAAVIGLAFYGGWLRGFGPSEMDEVDVFSVAPDGEWIEVWGTAPRHLDVRRRVLMSSNDDRYLALPVSWNESSMELAYSADGGGAVGFNHVSGSGNFSSLWWLDLTADQPVIMESLLVVPQRTVPGLSPDGSRVALLEDGTLSVYDLVSEQLVAAIRLPAPYRKATVLFHEHDRLRLFARPGGDEALMTMIAEVDLELKKLDETGRIEGAGDSSWMQVDSSATRMVFCVRENRGQAFRCSVHDGGDGSLIRELDHGGLMRFLEDGRLVSLTGSKSEGRRLLVESADGLTTTEHSVGEADMAFLGGEALPGQIVVARLLNLEEVNQGYRYELVDVDSGAVRLIGSGLRKGYPGIQRLWGGGSTVLWYLDSPESNWIFTDRTGAVVRWDPETGELVHVVGGRSP